MAKTLFPAGRGKYAELQRKADRVSMLRASQSLDDFELTAAATTTTTTTSHHRRSSAASGHSAATEEKDAGSHGGAGDGDDGDDDCDSHVSGAKKTVSFRTAGTAAHASTRLASALEREARKEALERRVRRELDAHRIRAWDQVVKRINDDATEEAWDKVIAFLGKGQRDLEVGTKKIQLLFEAFDSDGGGTLDVEELTEGLQTFDIYLTKQQVGSPRCGGRPLPPGPLPPGPCRRALCGSAGS